jgi:hypothetical protein
MSILRVDSKFHIMYDATKKTPYIPSPEDAVFINKVYMDFMYDRKLRMQSQPILNNRTLQQFWDESERDYNVIVSDENPNNPVTPYASSISRDKANTFISSLTQQLLYPSVSAQNSNQEIDRVISRACRNILEWQYENDGRPAESGSLKNARNIHRMVTVGTTHVMDNVDENGRLISQIIPNEEVYISNMFQPNIQLQPRLIRAQNAVTYNEVDEELGILKRFQDHVQPGIFAQMRLFEESEFRQWFLAITPKDTVHKLYCWYPVPREKLREYKKSGRLPSYVQRAKYFNILVNGVLMFDRENLMPYHHGHYPITKGIFEWFSNPEFYYGNSLPNKARHDKKWYDAFKTMIRHKAKLSVIPPLISFNGTFVDSDIVVPGMISAAPSGMTKDDIQAIPGISNGVNDSDLAIMRDGTADIDRSTTSPSMAGQSGSSRMTARESLLNEQNSQKAMQGFGLQIAYFVEGRTFPILKNSFQFLPRQFVNKICVPEQRLPDGNMGTVEILFVPPKEFTPDELFQTELAIYKEEKSAKQKGMPKKIVYINNEYIQTLDLYVKAGADQLIKETGALREAKAQLHFNTYMSRPDLFNVRAAARKLAYEFGDDVDEMVLTEQKAQVNPVPGVDEMGTGAGRGQDQNPLAKMGEQQGIATDNAGDIPSFA